MSYRIGTGRLPTALAYDGFAAIDVDGVAGHPITGGMAERDDAAGHVFRGG
jgi:hypothetical protein